MKILKEKFMIASILGIMLLSLSACGDKGEEKGKNNKEDVKKVNVEVSIVTAHPFTDVILTVGSVKPIQMSNVTYAEGGLLDEFYFDKGDYVKEGDTLFVIDNDLLRANYNAAKAQYELAEITFRKQEAIYMDNVNSEYQYLQAKLSRDQAKANYEFAKARYDKSFVTAPIEGFIDARNVNKGELVAPGVPVMTIINISKVKIEIGIPERYVGDVKVGSRATLKFPELNNLEIDGKVNFVSNSVSISNRTFVAEIIIDNPNNSIKTEMISEVSIVRAEYENVFTIPDDALMRVDDGYVIFVAMDGKAVRRPVNILSRFGDKVAIEEGLHNGDKLIVVGQQKLLDGTEVIIVN